MGIDIPKISGNCVVYIETHDERKRVYAYDLTNKKKTQITFHDFRAPAISGNRIVFKQAEERLHHK